DPARQIVEHVFGVAGLVGGEVVRTSRMRHVVEILARAEEPESVPDNRKPERRGRLEHLLQAVGGRKTSGDQSVRDVVALEAVSCPTEIKVPMERIAAVARKHVDADAAAGRISGNSARLI